MENINRWNNIRGFPDDGDHGGIEHAGYVSTDYI